MRGAREEWYAKVEAMLYSYRKLINRVEYIMIELDMDAAGGIAYDKDKVQTSSIADSTFELVINRLESKKADEVKRIQKKIKLIEKGLERLTEEEENLVRTRYFAKDRMTNEEAMRLLYMDKDKYYRVKKAAICELGESFGVK